MEERFHFCLSSIFRSFFSLFVVVVAIIIIFYHYFFHFQPFKVTALHFCLLSVFFSVTCEGMSHRNRRPQIDVAALP